MSILSGKPVQCHGGTVLRDATYVMQVVSVSKRFTEIFIDDNPDSGLCIGSKVRVRICACDGGCRAAFVLEILGGPAVIRPGEDYVDVRDLRLEIADFSQYDEGGVV